MGERIFYAEDVAEDNKAFLNTFVQARDDERTGLLRSEQAFLQTNNEQTGRYAVFLDGVSYDGLPGSLDYIVTDFQRYALLIESSSADTDASDTEYMATIRLATSGVLAERAEPQSRFGLPIATLVLTCLAVTLAATARDRFWYLSFISSIAVYFTYTNLLAVAKELMISGTIPSVLGIWCIHALFFLLFVVLQSFDRPRRRKRRATTPI